MSKIINLVPSNLFMRFKNLFSILKSNKKLEILPIVSNVSLFSLKFLQMATSSKPNLKPPLEVHGLTKLDKTLFNKTIPVACLILKEVKPSSVLPLVKKFLLKMDNLKPVVSLINETHIYLNPEVVSNWEELNEETRRSLKELGLTENDLKVVDCTLTYENYSLESVLRSVLPSNIEGMSSFTKVGHIVHVNLREHLLPYKDLIGQVLYEKVPNCKTVVNKIANIDNTYRNFTMEVLQGETDMITTVKENSCSFKFDFSKVYWNSRLCTEHERIVNMIPKGSVVFDIFAGVGPFSIPLAKKKCQVFANDLNPESYKWLNYNSELNKIEKNYLKTFNKDGKDFIVDDIKKNMELTQNNQIYILMNLPALAVDFLKNFVGLFETIELEHYPVIIVYCFAKGEDYTNITKKLINDKIGFDITDKIINIFRVRTVSSMKEMMRIEFKLDREILIRNKRKNDNFLGDSKKCCYGEKPQEN